MKTCCFFFLLGSFLPAAIAFFPSYFARAPVTTDVHLTPLYIPAAIQVIVNILVQLDSLQLSRYKTLPPVVIYHREENGTVHLEFIDLGEKAERPGIKSTKRRLEHLLTILNKEAQKQHLDLYQGMTQDVMIELQTTSKMPAREQLLFILGKVSVSEISESTRTGIEKILSDLQDPGSSLSQTINGVKALPYVP